MKFIKGFVTNQDYMDHGTNTAEAVFDLTDYASTYAKSKQYYIDSQNPKYSLVGFSIRNATTVDTLTQQEVDAICKVIHQLVYIATNTFFPNKTDVIANVISTITADNPINTTLISLTYDELSTVRGFQVPSQVFFVFNNRLTCNIWLSDVVFRNTFPDYEIDVILPFTNLGDIVANTEAMITALNNFDVVTFNADMELRKDSKPPSYTKIMNIPYYVPGTSIVKNCYFGFNIYGNEGGYEDILKIELQQYLTTVVGLTVNQIDNYFPDINKINEFFFIPRWDMMAISSHVGAYGIYSQVTKAFNDNFDVAKFISVYTPVYIKDNSYNVPVVYKNLDLLTVNGRYSKPGFKDFKALYGDYIATTSTSIDFSRMAPYTQTFLTQLEYLLLAADSANALEAYTKISNNENKIKTRTRGGIEYLITKIHTHFVYMLPKYEYTSLTS